jgi:hypothetical protein
MFNGQWNRANRNRSRADPGSDSDDDSGDDDGDDDMDDDEEVVVVEGDDDDDDNSDIAMDEGILIFCVTSLLLVSMHS